MHGDSRDLRRRTRRLARLGLVLSAFVFLPSHLAEARLDPLRVITSQIVQPNILVVVDTSGSMAERPETSDFPDDIVGGDCYKGEGVCNPNRMANTCSDGTACGAANTCSDQTTSCTPGVAQYCADGSQCLPGRLCGKSPNQTLCPASSATCKDGSSCWNRCNDNKTLCQSGSDCPALSCSGAKCSDGSSCTAQGTCTAAPKCVSNWFWKTCSTDSSRSCSRDSDCPANTCGGGTCSGGDTPSGGCSSSSDCPGACDNSSAYCPANSGSTVCAFWCNDGTQCSGSTPYCKTDSGAIGSCMQCPDNGSCYNYSHCGSSRCPSGANYYKGSSRLAIAKRVINSVVASSSSLVHFGLMAFNQATYFPYYKSKAATTKTVINYWDDGKLMNRGGWDFTTNQPKTSFTDKGVTYTLSSSPSGGGNSQYRRQSWLIFSTTNQHDFCGTSCRFDGYTWSYQGSWYSYQQQINSGSTSQVTVSSYQGPSYTSGNYIYSYYSFPYDYANSDPSSIPISGLNYSPNSCNDSYSADGDLLVPIALSDDSATQQQSVNSIQSWMADQNAGGLVAQGGTPTGCTLQFASSGRTSWSSLSHDAYSYLAQLADGDSLKSCRQSNIILVTDGEPTGPGDNNCDSSACAAADPKAAGCSCKTVLAAYNLRKDLGVKVYTIGFGSGTSGSQVLYNIGKAGGACQSSGQCAFQAGDEASLTRALQTAIYDAVKGDYATSQPTVATRTGSNVAGDAALLVSADFPSFQGHLRAYDLVNQTDNEPTLLWDAGEVLAQRTWNTRRVFTSDPKNSHALVPLVKGDGSANGAALFALGLGASADEATSMIQFALGAGRSWSLGSFLNSTPVVVGKAIEIDLPGHAQFVQAQSTKRPKMIYVGSDDMMLHAFYLEGSNAGDEAWAYIPPDLLPSLASLYANGGQPSNPTAHVYGISSSPKVNDVCTGSCSTATDWHTVLVSGEGPGGNNYFALDITALPDAASPFAVLWHTNDNPSIAPQTGESWSVPAFSFIYNSGLSSRLFFGSGYDDTPSDGRDQGNYVQLVDPFSGAQKSSLRLGPPSSPVTTYAVLADTAVAMDPQSNKALAAYQADLGGRIWRIDTSTSPTAKSFLDLGRDHPFYYSPAVMAQQDGTVVVVANDSTFDDISMNQSNSPTPSISITFDRGGTATNTQTFALTSLCKSGCRQRSCSSCPKFTSTARPTSSPVLLSNGDSTATAQLQALFLIYQPATSACSAGTSSLLVFDIPSTSGAVVQSQALSLPTAGKASGLFLGAGGEVMAGLSGSGSNRSKLQVIAGQPSVAAPTGSVTWSAARVMGMTETGF